MHKIISAAVFVLATTVASVQTASAFPIIIIPLPGNGGGSVTSPGEPFQPFKREPRGGNGDGVAASSTIAEACDDLGGKLLEVQDGAEVKWVCVR